MLRITTHMSTHATKHQRRNARRKQLREADALEQQSGGMVDGSNAGIECDAFEGSFATSECKVDREANVVRNCKVIGFTSRNGRKFKPEAIQASVSMYEGKQVYLDHPDIKDIAKTRGVRDKNGVLKNAKFVEGSGVHADWHFNPKHSATEALIYEVENNSSTLGFSHNARYRYGKPEGGTDVVEAIVAVRSVDLVTDPATTNGMFEGVIAEKMAEDELTEKIQAARDLLCECCYDRMDGDGKPIDRKAKALAIATDLVAELNKSTSTASESAQGDDDVKIEEYSLEAIIAARPDVADLSKSAKLSDADRTELESLRAANRARELADAIEADIAASGMDRAKITPAITATLHALESTDRKALLSELAAISKGSPAAPQTQKPTTATRLADATESTQSAEEWAARFTGIPATK